MKIRWIGIALSLFLLVGITAFWQRLLRYDQENQIQDILNKGNYLVSLIALHPLEDLDGNKRKFFLKTLAEYVSSEGLAYCLIHDREGNSLLSLAPHDLASKRPHDIQTRSIYTMSLMRQTFRISGWEEQIYEFAKPFLENGERTGTVRLGFKIPPISLISVERIGLLGVMVFFIFAAAFFVYYGMTVVLRPFKKLNGIVENTCTALGATDSMSGKDAGISGILQHIEQSFSQLRERLDKTETDNVDIAAKLGVTTFEKNQVSKIIDSINLGIVITDIQDNISYINDYMLNLLNKDRNEVVDRVLGEVLEHDEITSFISQQESLKSTGTMGHIETTFPDLAPGEMFQLSLSNMKDGEGSVTGNIVLVKNITSEKSSENVQHEFMASVAHEFLTPLTTIKSYNEMLMDGEIDDREMQKEFYNTIAEETGRLSRLIQNLLNLAKIETGSLTLNTGLVKTDWLVDDCIAAVEPSAKKKRITIQKNLPDNFPSLLGDKELLKTAVINLLGNAVKYSPESASITFSLIDQDEMVLLEVIDTGYGVSEEDLPHIFDKFYRSKDPHIVEQMGSGLGLAMTLQIIQLHGGEIEVQSEIGEGSHFTISFPKEEYYLGEQ
jgi:signal transduction histidine kinase